MKTIVFYSMGVCSCYIACRLQDECQEAVCLWSDTKREDGDTYRFGKQVAERWGLNVMEASDGRDLWDVWRQQHIIPARQLSQCSITMKIKPSQKYLESITEPGRVAYGYDLGEEDRAERTERNWKHKTLKPWFPLLEWGISKEQCFGYFQQHGIEVPRMYQQFQHANCLPCKNFRVNDWKALQYHYPEKFAEAAAFEAETGMKWMQEADAPRLLELPMLEAAPGRKGRRKLAGDEPAFSFDMGCDRCAIG